MEVVPTVCRFGAAGTLCLAALFAAAGCTNKPGALTLKVSPAREEFRADEPVQLRAVLTAESDRVLLSESCWWQVRMNDSSDKVSLRSQRPTRPHRSHSTKSEIAAPFLYLGHVFDVGDSGDRFVRMHDGDRRTFNLTLRLLDGDLYAFSDDRGEPPDAGSPQHWRPGTYTITVSLENQSEKPAPLFYRPYKRRVEAECQVRIAR